MSATVLTPASRSIRLFLDLRGSTFALGVGANILGYTPLKNNGTAGLSLQESLYDTRKLGRRRVEGVLLANHAPLFHWR
jgi:hypothetical protein